MHRSFTLAAVGRRAAAAALLLCGAGAAQAIVGGTSTSAFGQVDSGVQITDNWVLTARHVGYAVGGTYSNGYGSATIAARYDLGGGVTLQNDLALLRLGTAIDVPELSLSADVLAPGVLGSPFAATIATGRNQVPQGYAFTTVHEVWNQVSTGSLPFAVNWLVAYNFTGTGFTTPYVQGGDSGGGLFLGQVTDSSSALLGITSTYLEGTVMISSAGGLTEVPFFGSAFVQLAAYRGWIDTTMAADVTDAQLATWVSSVPEPESALLWALGLAGLVGRRRG
jgi:MYXO-CTERM domain-containing protein